MSKNIFISCKESRIENNRSFYGCFSLGPFEAGQSLTVANALRRTLLSECPGLGIISVTIENVSHEYSTLPGMRESVLDLLLNLKEIVLKKKKNAYASFYPFSYFSEEAEAEGASHEWEKGGASQSLPEVKELGSSSPLPSERAGRGTSFHPVQSAQSSFIPEGFEKQKAGNSSLDREGVFTNKKENNAKKKILKVYNQIGASYFKPVSGFLKIKGPGVVRAKDLKLPPFIECVDPEQYIATLAEDGFLCMKFIIMEGKGYFIQKNNIFLDKNLVKNRTNFFNVLALPPTLKGKGVSFVSPGARRAFPTPLSLTEGRGVRSAVRSTRNAGSSIGGVEKENRENYSNPLNLDTIFNPITKISYLIEDFDNKISDHSHKNLEFLNSVYSLIESSHYLKQNFPFLTNQISFNSQTKLLTPPPSSPIKIGVGKRNGGEEGGAASSPSARSTGPFLPSEAREGKGGKPVSGDFQSHEERGRDFSKIIETYSAAEIQQLSDSLQPLKKQSSLHTIVLEIWTNGSVHPREALLMAFQNLASVFLNLQKTKLYSSLYINEASYQKSLSDLGVVELRSFPPFRPVQSTPFSLPKGKGVVGSLASLGKERSSPPSSLAKQDKGRGEKENLFGVMGEGSTEREAPFSITHSSEGSKGLGKKHINMNKGIEFLNIPLRAYTLLKRSNINKISHLCNLTMDDLELIFTNSDKKYVKMIVNAVLPHMQ